MKALLDGNCKTCSHFGDLSRISFRGGGGGGGGRGNDTQEVYVQVASLAQLLPFRSPA